MFITKIRTATTNPPFRALSIPFPVQKGTFQSPARMASQPSIREVFFSGGLTLGEVESADYQGGRKVLGEFVN